MASDQQPPRYSGRLKRLDDSFYKGKCYVHWTYGIQARATGWLSTSFCETLLAEMREWLVRYHLCCYGYCLMPDHGHFLVIGLNDRADQLAFVREFSRIWNRLLKPLRLARQPFDTVLRESDRAAGGFAELANYIWHNPVRAGWVDDWRQWEYLGCVLPGYASLDPRKLYFRENFWKGYLDQSD
jgi:REP element-mobilizing transposase RayT